MPTGFTHKAVAHLTAAILAADVQCQIYLNEYDQVLAAYDDVYLMLRGPVYRELVKVDLSASKWGEYLTVARGQGGTSARTWPVGTLLFSTTHADHYNSIVQRGASRTIDYNPNQILAPLYAGEKIYQNGPAGCERWWKSFNGSDAYWDLITGAACSAESYEDVGFDYPLLIPGETWEVKLDNTFWQQSATEPYGVWNGAQNRWEAQFYDGLWNWISIVPATTWNVNYEPDALRITSPYGPSQGFNVYILFGTHLSNIGQKRSGDIITYGTSIQTYGWISGIRILFSSMWSNPYLTNIEFRIP